MKVASERTTKCGCSIIKADEDKKASVALRIEWIFPSNGEIFSLRTNFCTELEQFDSTPSANFQCVCNSTLQIECLVLQEIVVFQEVLCTPKKDFDKRARQGVPT